MRTIIHICLPALLTLAPLTASAQDSTYTTKSEEPSRGTGKVVGGILLTSIGPTIGGILLLLGLEAMPDCSGEEGKYAEDCERRSSNASGLMLGGLAIGGASLGVGIPLIASGVSDRKKWKSWKTERVHEGQARRPGSTLSLGFKREGQGGAATLTFGY